MVSEPKVARLQELIQVFDQRRSRNRERKTPRFVGKIVHDQNQLTWTPNELVGVLL